MSDYRKDIETIKSLMVAYDERNLVEHWVFFVYGAFCLTGTVVSWFMVRRAGLTGMPLLLQVWLPLFLVAATGETVGFLRQLQKAGAFILPRRTRKFLIAAGGTMFVVTWFLVRAIPEGVSPGIILAYAAVPFFIYAQASYWQLFVEAFFLIALGIVVDVAGWRGLDVNAAAGMVAAIVYTVGGVHSKRCEKTA